jgi:hypothetical protein
MLCVFAGLRYAEAVAFHRGHAMRRIVALAITAAALTSVAASLAEAQTRRPRTLTVTPRSYLDPGNVVPVGSLSNYVLAGTVLAQPVTYGQPKQDYPLPHRFDVPGRNPFPPFSFPATLDVR